MTLQPYNDSHPDDVARETANGDDPDASDVLAEHFLWLFPIALLAVAVFGALIAGSP